jgi:fatty-acyl-CoA synthase
MHGSRLVLPGPNLQPERVLDLVSAQRVTVMGTTPSVWLTLLDALDRQPERWELVRGTRVVVGDPDGPGTIFRRLDAFGMRSIRPWSLTEMAPLDGPAVWIATADQWDLDRKFRQWKVLIES